MSEIKKAAIYLFDQLKLSLIVFVNYVLQFFVCTDRYNLGNLINKMPASVRSSSASSLSSSDDEKELTIADTNVVTKYKMAGAMNDS